MTIEQRLQWVALPNGASEDGGELRLSVFMAPRLRTDEAATLAPFPDFLDWPARLTGEGVRFAVELADGSSVPATVLSAPPESALWTRFFGPGTVLRPFVFERFADRPIVSYSVGAVLAELRRIYAAVAAASPGELPRMLSRPDLDPPETGTAELFASVIAAAVHGELRVGADGDEDLDRRIEDVLQTARDRSAERRTRGGPPSSDPVEPLRSNGGIAWEFERALLFHRRPGDPVAMPSDRLATRAAYEEAIDFHRMLAALGDHPFLLRRLGLVVDLGIPADAVPAGDDLAPVLLRVRPTWASLSAPGISADVAPPTACVHQRVGGEVFFGAADLDPNPAAPHQAPPTGLLSLPPASFALQQVDVDGAALKALNLAVTLDRAASRAPGETPFEEPDRTGLPAVRTGPLALVHNRRAASLQREFGRAATLNDGVEGAVPAPLYAGDLVRGMRMDIWEGRTGSWRSLHERAVSYEVEGLAEPLPPQLDEGFFQLSAAGKALAPGQAPDPDGELYVHETVVSWDGWSLAVARPGKSLSSDARAPTDEHPETQPQRVPNEAFTTLGLAIETAPRSGTLPRLRFGDTYRVRVRTVDLAGNGPTLAEADRRLATAETDTPVVPATDAFRYLRFEPVPAPALAPRAGYGEGSSLLRLAIRSAAGVGAAAYADAFNASELVAGGAHAAYRAYDDRHVVAPKAALDLVERHGRFDAVVGSDGQAPDEERRAAMAAAYEVARREKGGLAELEAGEVLDLPYLPDPLATGAVLFGLPGVPAGEAYRIDFGGPEWFRAAPFRLVLQDGADGPSWDAAGRVLSVSLPQAATASVRLCSLFGGGLRDTGIVQWCEQTLPPAELEKVLEEAAGNRCWLLTPWHELRLVHAVQAPLATPQWQDFTVDRVHSALSADVSGLVDIHPASTEKIDLVADWTEWDDLTRLGPEVRASSQVVFSLPIQLAARHGNEVGPRTVPHSLHDGRLLAFRSSDWAEPTPVTAHAFGDTKHRLVNYRVVATTPFREYFPREWSSEPERLSDASDSVQLHVPSSAPPATPRVHYVVPTQGWGSSDDGAGTTTRTRRGGGLRVYLGRPWFSSGDGELLGVVVGGSAPVKTSTEYPFVTLVGQDPVRGAGALAYATPSRFRGASTVATNMRLLELGDHNDLVTIVGYEVSYDEEGKRWFCDVELDTEEAYFPFVRLALVRYQPHSLTGCHVSRVVTCDIAQTLPDRTLTVRRDPDDPEVVELSVAGPSYSAIAGPLGPRVDPAALGRMVASLEERDPAFADDVIGWRPVAGVETELAPTARAGVVTWTGRLRVGGAVAGGARRRIALVEHDHLIGDQETADAAGLVPRIVYADVAEI